MSNFLKIYNQKKKKKSEKEKIINEIKNIDLVNTFFYFFWHIIALLSTVIR